jgi:hypothetical protein
MSGPIQSCVYVFLAHNFPDLVAEQGQVQDNLNQKFQVLLYKNDRLKISRTVLKSVFFLRIVRSRKFKTRKIHEWHSAGIWIRMQRELTA